MCTCPPKGGGVVQDKFIFILIKKKKNCFQNTYPPPPPGCLSIIYFSDLKCKIVETNKSFKLILFPRDLINIIKLDRGIWIVFFIFKTVHQLKSRAAESFRIMGFLTKASQRV